MNGRQSGSDLLLRVLTGDRDGPPWGRCLLLAELEHELGDNVTVISGWVERLEDPSYPEMARIYATKRLREAVHRLRTALRYLSSRSTQFPPRLGIVDVGDLVATALCSIDPRVHQSFQLKHVRESAPLPVIADDRALDHVVVNLIMSAATTGEPGDRVVVETARFGASEWGDLSEVLRRAERYVRVSVRLLRTTQGDAREGEGRTASPGVRPMPPICDRIVDEHAGFLRITSEPGCPSHALVVLPAFRSHNGESCETDDRERGEAP